MKREVRYIKLLSVMCTVMRWKVRRTSSNVRRERG